MNDLICPYSATLVRADFGCRHAQQVIRRGGTEFACLDEAAHADCKRLYSRLRDAALPALGVGDDPAQAPHGALSKIQFGGLLGLHELCAGPAPADGIGDISALVQSAAARFGDIDAIPCTQLVDAITGYRLARRRERRR